MSNFLLQNSSICMISISQISRFQTPPLSSLNLFMKGQKYEFQQNDYNKALIAYERAFAQFFEPSSKAEILNCIARVQKKMSRFEDAVISYTRLTQEYKNSLSSIGVPIGLAARLELGSLFLNRKDSISAGNYIATKKMLLMW